LDFGAIFRVVNAFQPTTATAYQQSSASTSECVRDAN